MFNYLFQIEKTVYPSQNSNTYPLSGDLIFSEFRSKMVN